MELNSIVQVKLKIDMRKVVLRFNFTDHRLAFQVRGTVYNALKKYDFNQNGLFEEEEIKQALLEILGENENEVHYVVKNVYRYDVDHDNLITYEEFVIGFLCVRQIFVLNNISEKWQSNAFIRRATMLMDPRES